MKSLPPPLIQKTYDMCLVKGCGKATDGKPYCSAHFTPTQRRKLTQEVTATIRSSCCNAKCVSGEPHEHGEQYCTKCKEPCIWTRV